jgi:hypothetical protein
VKDERARLWAGHRAAVLAISLSLAAAALAAPLVAPDPAANRVDPAARMAQQGSASEYWDLVARLDSNHRVFARFMITNQGPGTRTALATGHLVQPDGTVVPFHNGRRWGRWKLGPDGLRVEIGSSLLDLRGPVRRFEVDKRKKGIQIRLDYSPGQPRTVREGRGPGGYAIDLLELAEPVEGSVWVAGMAEPLAVRGTIAVTHTWMGESESDLALRRIDALSMDAERGLFLTELATPGGERSRWLVLRDRSQFVFESGDFELWPEPPASAGIDPDYPIPAALKLRGREVEGEIRLGGVLAQHDPLEALPQPFRLLLSFEMRPRRAWTDAFLEVRLNAGADRPALQVHGSGIASVTYLNPFSSQVSS